MIYTVTFNPSLDYIVSVDNFQTGRTNRANSQLILPGGKGINVSMVLKNLGIDSIALGFVAGFIGDEIEKRLKAMDMTTDFIRIPYEVSRINVKLKSIEGTEINGMGPKIREDKVNELIARLDALEQGDILILAGSIPSSVPENIYGRILEKVKEKQVMAVVDATKDLLLNVLKYKPFLIKPNIHELGELFAAKVHDKKEAAEYGRKLQEMGAKNVLISMAGEGAVFVAENGSVLSARAPKGTLVNGVGAGDSMVAGFLAGWLFSHDYDHAFSMGLAAGSASAFSENLATGDEIMSLLKTFTLQHG